MVGAGGEALALEEGGDLLGGLLAGDVDDGRARSDRRGGASEQDGALVALGARA